MKKWKLPLLFCLGGGAYVGLEFLYRGYSHGSMFVAGGLCFLLIGGLRELPILPALAWGVASVTAVELLTGLLVNRDFAVWDYRHQWGNFLGQICPLFMALWIPVTLAGRHLYGWADKMLDRMRKKAGF